MRSKKNLDYLDFKEFVAEQPRGAIRKNIGFDSKTKSWNVEMDVKVLDSIYGEGTPSDKKSGWYGGLPDDFESVIIESVVTGFTEAKMTKDKLENLIYSLENENDSWHPSSDSKKKSMLDKLKKDLSKFESVVTEEVVYNSSNTKPEAAKKATKEFGKLLPKANKGVEPYVFAVIKTKARNYRLAIKSGSYVAHEFMSGLRKDGILTADIVKKAVANVIKLNPEEFNEAVVTEAKAYKLKASEFGGDTHSAAYNVKGEPTWRVHSTYAIDQVSGENNPEERDVVFFEAMPINNDIYIKIGGINNLKRANGSTVGENFGTTIEEWKKDSKGIAKEASEFLTDATHLKWINKKARSEGQVIKWALKDDYSSVIEDLVNKSLGLKESVVNEDFPGKGETVKAKDLNHEMLDYFNRMNISLSINTKSKKNIKGSVGTMFNDLVFNGGDIDKNDIVSVKIIESMITEGSEKETAKEIFYELMDVNGEEIADMDSQEAMTILSRRGIRGGKANKIAKELLKLTAAINEAKIWMVNEWGSSDQSNFNKSMHKEMGSPRKMPSPFDDKLRDVAADNVDHYWDDWDEYDTDRDGLIDNAVRHYLRAFFKKDFEMMQKMFASNNITEGMSKSAIKKMVKVIDKQIDTETGGDGEALDNETLQALEQERERLLAMNEGKFSPIGYAKRVNEKAEGDRGPISDPKIEKALKTKSEETGVPIGIIRIVMRRGMAAWKTGHRPGATEQQWGYARVNAFLTKGKGTWGDADKDVAKEVRDEGHDDGLKEHFDQSYRTI